MLILSMSFLWRSVRISSRTWRRPMLFLSIRQGWRGDRNLPMEWLGWIEVFRVSLRFLEEKHKKIMKQYAWYIYQNRTISSRLSRNYIHIRITYIFDSYQGNHGVFLWCRFLFPPKLPSNNDDVTWPLQRRSVKATWPQTAKTATISKRSRGNIPG